MRLLGLDLETTGLDTANDRITELGAVLWEVETKRPLVTQACFMWDEGIRAKCKNPETVAMMERVCGLTPALLQEFGVAPADVFAQLERFCAAHRPDYLVAHNAFGFDMPFLMAEMKKVGVEAPVLGRLPWIDTRQDIPFATEPDSRKLKHLALDAGFINPFAHRAVFDVLTMLRVLSNYNIQEVIEYAKIPLIVVRALVEYEQRELAKAQRFSWEKIGDRTYPKMWVKQIREHLFQQEQGNCRGFRIVRIQ